MKNSTPSPEPPPAKPEETRDLIPTTKKSNKKLLATVLLLAVFMLAVLVPAVMNYQTISGRAANPRCRLISRVAINPPDIFTDRTSLPTNLSVMAFDANDTPITEQVQYDWGMSSTNSIGTIKAKNDLGTFFPKNIGTGDLYVKTKNSCTKIAVVASIKVTVAEEVFPNPTFKQGRGVIKGLAFGDSNSNGVQDEGETGIRFFKINLYDAATDTPVATTGSDDSGFFTFVNIPLTSYRIEAFNPTGDYTITKPTATVTLTNSHPTDTTATIGVIRNY